MIDDPTSHKESVYKLAGAMLRTAIVPAVVTVVVAVVVAGLVVGETGAYGALVGGVIATASSLLTIVFMRFSADLPAQMVIAVAMGGYLIKIVLLMAAMLPLKGVSALDTYSLGLTVLAVVLVWAVAEVVAFKRTKLPTLIL